MNKLLNDAVKLFSKEIIFKHFLERCIQKGYIDKKHKYKILKEGKEILFEAREIVTEKKKETTKAKKLETKTIIKTKTKTKKLETIVEKNEERNIFEKHDCEYEINVPIVPDYQMVNIDGIDYYQNIKTKMIIDTNDFGELGVWNAQKSHIDFISDEHMKFHKLKLK